MGIMSLLGFKKKISEQHPPSIPYDNAVGKKYKYVDRKITPPRIENPRSFMQNFSDFSADQSRRINKATDSFNNTDLPVPGELGFGKRKKSKR